MILVDIYVPSIGNTYDFQLDEEVPVGNVIEEISEMIGQKEHCRIVGDMTKLMLCAQTDSSQGRYPGAVSYCNRGQFAFGVRRTLHKIPGKGVCSLGTCSG